MTDAIALLWPPFVVALCLTGIHALFGLEILRRNVIFVDLALAQIAVLALAACIKPLLRASSARRFAVAARAMLAVSLIASGVWLAAPPRADQPLLDSLEHAVPAARTLYMSERELQTFNEAAREAARYRTLAAQLSRKEQDSRWQGAALDDLQVRRISSFMQSYNEMRKGEEFVQREVRSRARAAARGWLGALLMVVGLLMAPWRQVS